MNLTFTRPTLNNMIWTKHDNFLADNSYFTTITELSIRTFYNIVITLYDCRWFYVRDPFCYLTLVFGRVCTQQEGRPLKTL